MVEEAAEAVNRSTDEYLSHAASQVPITDPRDGLRELGYEGQSVHLLQGAHRSAELSIKGAILEGYDAIPDCSFTDFGVSSRMNTDKGYYLTAVLLAGP
ncbi:hypothetical protein [Mycobacterium sp. 1274756.6]|uniref:hypothetical protein n=1 Tax=Mycobacterium sp. 1274756.6 TaxID=1834076 RepID=UPI001E45FA56|nr:hypothetical protein [Mycobacterium sp. 1274756.6]